jgi:deazaflavin-dependent oxidoreductase (nitroreductase family)
MTVELTPSGSRGRKFPGGPVVRWGMALNAALYRLFGGRGMTKMLLLTTVGARTGERRTTPLACVKDGDAWLVIGSKGGNATHPGWYLNLAKNPDQVWIEVGNRKLKVIPESLHGDERAERWARITAEMPNMAEYQKQTDRELPVVRLRPA